MNTFVTLITAQHRYIARRGQRMDLCAINRDNHQHADERGKPLLCYDLALLLDADDAVQCQRCHAVVIPMRRQSIALLVRRVEDAKPDVAKQIQPLTPMMQRCAHRQWVAGIAVTDDTPIVVLDLQQIAHDITLGTVTPNAIA